MPHTMVSAAQNGYLVVHRHEFDCAEKALIITKPLLLWPCEWVRRTVAISFLNGCVQRSSLVRTRVPENFQMLLRAISF